MNKKAICYSLTQNSYTFINFKTFLFICREKKILNNTYLTYLMSNVILVILYYCKLNEL